MTRKYYALAVLTFIVVAINLDRVALGIVMQGVKGDLQLSDTQLGFLSGIAFALFYSIMGLPLARLADRGNRVTVISICGALAGLAISLCAAAASFVQLLAIRVAVAVGEAGCIPPAFSLIADYFERGKRPRAVAIFGFAAPISVMVGYFCAGWLNELYGWRVTFAALGVPAAFFAILVWLTLKEPRQQATLSSAEHAASPGIREVVLCLWKNVTFRHLAMCLSVMFFFIYGIMQWLPVFLIRSYGLGTGTVGMWLAGALGLSGIAGAFLGGELATRYAPGNEALQLRGIAIAVGISALLSTSLYLLHDIVWAFVMLALWHMLLMSIQGPLFATIQTMVPERMRAVAFAVIYLFANLLGMGFGPLATGAMSDAFRPWAGEESLRFALLVLSPGYLWAASHAWLAARTVKRDLFEEATDRPGSVAATSL